MDKTKEKTKDSTKDRTVEQEAEAQREELKKHGDKVDIAEDDSFPASDPPSYSPVRGEKEDKRPLKRQADKK